ncbi:MAG: hypothetical protein LAT64_13030 [Phycisphaerales bacterium]|nr:hypothetical protein [Planctomycetota bacterium]MCH8509678.1 hypothetical protein [Phycisphaerales bacterium]
MLAAVVLFAGSHAARVAPEVQKRGWGAAVPGVVLVAWMPLLSEEPGTGLDGFGMFGGSAALPRASGMDRLVMKEIGDGWYWGGRAPEQRLGWVSRRLLFLLARTECVAVMTDGTTAKGRAYKNAVTKVLHGGMARETERRWAHGVAHIEAEPDRAYGPNELVRGNFRIRRLVVGSYTLSGSVGRHLVEYQGFSPSSMRFNGMIPTGTPQQLAAHWIDRFLWDNTHEPAQARGRVYFEPEHPFGFAEPDGSGGAAVKLHYAVMVNEADPGEPERMAMVATIERSVPVQIDENRAMVVDQSSGLRTILETNLRAELTVEYDTTRKAWVPLVKLRWVGERPQDQTVLFGGMVSVDFVRQGTPAGQGRALLESRHDQSWWLVGPVSTGERRSELTTRPGHRKHFSGEVETNWILPSVRDHTPHRLMVRITPLQGNTPRTYGGLWADRVYDGMLVVPLDRWTLDEVRRYIVNGTVPDHAMP